MKLPTVLNLDGPVIIFGGGNVGLRKVEYLLQFTKDIIVVAQEFQSIPDHVRAISASLSKEELPKYIPEDASLVVAALSDIKLNHEIARLCRERGILVNVVDDPDPSTVLFPALSREGDLNIAISTSGKCPFLAKRTRMEIDDWISIKADWLDILGPIRTRLIGNPDKDRLLSMIYDDPEMKSLMEQGQTQQAKKKAEEIVNVHSRS